MSIVLTAIVSLIAPFTIPLLLSLQMEHFLGSAQTIKLDVVKTIVTLLVITVFPVSLGMLIRNRAPAFAAKADQPVKILSLVFLAIVVVGICLQNWSNLQSMFGRVGLACLTLNVLAMIGGFYLGKVFRLPRKDNKTIAMEIGIQNGTTALFVTSTLLGDSVMAMPAATYSLIMFGSGAIFAKILSKG